MLFLSAFEPNETVDFPENFNVSSFLRIVMENCQVDPEWDTTDKLCMRETSIYENLKNEPRFVQFLKIQWSHLVSSLKEKAVGKTDLYEQKELTAFCSAVFCHATSDIILDQFASLINIDKSSFSTEHYTCCSEIVFNLATLILQILASKYTGTLTEPFKSLENMSSDEKGKIRYVGGWVFKKVMLKAKRYIEANITSSNLTVREQLMTEVMKVKIIEGLIASSLALHEHSEHQDSLKITDEKQNRSQGLLNICDSAFLYFTKLEESPINSLTRSKLNILKGDVVIDCMKTVKENGELHELWQHMTGELKFALTDDNSTKVLLFDKCCKLLFGELIERYLKMAVGEFLRDFRRDVEWKKAEAHRRKVQMKAEKKEIKADQIKMSDINNDQTPRKCRSHSQLKAMLIKYPRIFHDSRVYVKKDVEILLKAYGVNKKGTKAALADKLIETINTHEEMVDLTAFD